MVAGVGAKLDQPGDEMERVGAFALQLEMVDRGLVADLELGHGIALQPAPAEAAA